MNQLLLQQLKEIIEHNHKQLEKVQYDQNQADNLFTMDHNGIEVYDFFHDETLRENVAPFEYYGSHELEGFIRKATEQLNKSNSESRENNRKQLNCNDQELGKMLYHDWRIQVEDNNSYDKVRAILKEKRSLSDIQSGFVEERCKFSQKQPDEEDAEAFYGAIDEIGIEHYNKNNIE